MGQEGVRDCQRAGRCRQSQGALQASHRADQCVDARRLPPAAAGPRRLPPPPPPPPAAPPPPPTAPLAPPDALPQLLSRAPAHSLIDVEVDEVDFEMDDDIEDLDDDDEIELIDEEGIEELDDVDEVADATPEPVASAAPRDLTSSVGYRPIPPPSLPPPRSLPAESLSSPSTAPESNRDRPPASEMEAPPPSVSPDSSSEHSAKRPSSRSGSRRPARSRRPSSRSNSSPRETSPGVDSSSRSSAPSSQAAPAPASSRATRSRTGGTTTSRSRPGRTTTSPRLDRLPPSMRPEPSGIDLDDEAEDELEFGQRRDSEPSEDYGELHFGDEARTNRLDSKGPPPIPDLGPISFEGSHDLPIENQTAAEYAQRRGNAQHDHEALERELGVDLSLRGLKRSSRPPGSSGHPPGKVPKSEGAVRVSSYPSSVPPGVVGGQQRSESTIPELDLDARSPVPGRASTRPSPASVSNAPRTTSSSSEPYDLAPSATMPPISGPASVIEPPSSPTQAPPPSSMAEPEHRASSIPPPMSDAPDPTDIPPASAAPDPDEFEELFAKISVPPVAPVRPAPLHSEAPAYDESSENSSELRRRTSIPASPSLGEDGAILVDGLDLMEVEGFQDLPEDSALALAQRAELRTLSRQEEISGFGLAIVTHGAVTLMPSVADAACRIARRGQVLFTEGTLSGATTVRVVGLDDGSRVAVFSRADLQEAVSSCPWVGDELAEVADSHLGFAGAVLGPLGHSLDEVFRFMVLDKCTVKRRSPGDIIAHSGKTMDGMYILGGGSLEEVDAEGHVVQRISVGEFVFPETVLSASPARRTVRVGADGALVLYAPRMAAHELLATCPPFIELLAR